MAVDLELAPKTKRAAGGLCCEPVVFAAVRHRPARALPPPQKLRDAKIVDSERRGLWAYYHVLPDALEELTAWLS